MRQAGIAEHQIVPLQFLKAVLPPPESLGENYEGQTSIGCQIKGVKDGEDLAAIQEKTQALVQAAMKMGEAIYGAGGGEGAAAEEGAEDASSSGEDVVDAEFEEVDDDKKGQA